MSWESVGMLDFSSSTGDINNIYYFGVEYFNSFVHYLYRFVYDDGLKAVVIKWSLGLFIFLLFLYFIVGFLFVRIRK